MKMSNKVYDILKWVVTVILPGMGALYFTLSGIWGFPYGEQILGTFAAVETFLGGALMISNYQYNKTTTQ